MRRKTKIEIAEIEKQQTALKIMIMSAGIYGVDIAALAKINQSTLSLALNNPRKSNIALLGKINKAVKIKIAEIKKIEDGIKQEN